MDRRSFLKLAGTAGVLLASIPPYSSAQAWDELLEDFSISNGEWEHLNPEQYPNISFGPNQPVNKLIKRDGIWYALVGQPGYQFWLKSYNSRVWGSLCWKPRQNSSAYS